MENAITTTNISKTYRKKVVNNVSMTIPAGSVYGLVGENGAGKTTIMRLITGLTIPTSGTYSLFGIEANDKRIHDAKKKLAAIVEAPSLIPTMNAKDNLSYASMYLGIPVDEAKIDSIIDTVGLAGVGKKKVKDFSLGMRQRIGIGLCLLNDPQMMILDEPMNGLDPEGIAQLRDLIIKLNKEQGITFMISSHILSELEKVATMFGIISHGKLIKEITADQLRDECRSSLEIIVDNAAKTEEVFKSINITDYKEIGVNNFRVFDTKITSGELNKALVLGGVEVKRLVSNEETIEEYYLNIMKEGK
ncbi:MAG: ATP-binding cassette domain-containing protein [Bacilli bacterium]|nr:ATP-binding cassette domain-containing protein [Bacilli bacterium]